MIITSLVNKKIEELNKIDLLLKVREQSKLELLICWPWLLMHSKTNSESSGQKVIRLLGNIFFRFLFTLFIGIGIYFIFKTVFI